ncbi:MAG: hypothetical protein ACTSX7_06805, partial [Alphaproteobacteria bacterium]
MKLSLKKIRGWNNTTAEDGDAGPDDGALEARLAGLRSDFVAMAAEGPLYRIKRGRRSACRVLQISVTEMHTALRGGLALTLLAQADSGGQPDDGVDGVVHSELSPEDHDRWLARVRHLTQSGGAGCGLFLAFGLVELPESGTGAAMQAPLLLVPARMTRVGVADDTVPWRYGIAYSGGPWHVNGILQDALRRDRGLTLPSLGVGEAPADFLDRIEGLLAGAEENAGANLRRQVVLGVFDIRPAIVAQDLDARRWPEAVPPSRHPVMARLLGSAGRPERIVPVADMARRLILPANQAQRENLAEIMAGNDLVIEGAPGSGRSQTMANLIAAAMEKGQKILVVAAEPRALERVRQRLEAAGLGDFCLASASAGAAGGSSCEIERRRERLGRLPAPRPGDDPAKRIEENETALSEHAAWLDKGRNRLGLSARQVFIAALEYRGLLGQPLSHFRDIALVDAAAMDLSAMAQAEGDLEKFVQVLERVSPPEKNLADHPWHGITRATLNPTDWSALCDALSVWQRAGEPIETALAGLTLRTGIAMAQTPETVAALGDVYAALPEDLDALYPELLVRAGDGSAAAEVKAAA